MSGEYTNPVTVVGGLQTAGFGELLVAEPTPVAQFDFVYGTNANLVSSILAASGGVTASGGVASVSSGAATSSSATMHSRRGIRYRAGEGSLGRFTAVFTAGKAGSKQYAGMFTPTMTDGFGFGYDGTSFGIVRISGGSEVWVPQSSWNGDTCDGTANTDNPSAFNLDPTKGNVFQVRHQYLGFGNIRLYIVDPETSGWILVHTIKYPNAVVVPNVRQPSLNLVWRAENTTNETAIVVKAVSGALFIEGKEEFLGARYGEDNNRASITTIQPILTLRNATTFNGLTSRARVRLRALSYGSNAASQQGIVTIKAILNPATLTTTPSFSAIEGTTADAGVTITNGQSVVSVDKASTVVTGGRAVFNVIVGVGNSNLIDLTPYRIFLDPGDVMTWSAQSTQSALVGIGLTWNEEV